jgi:small subunit ribosomal protein S16
MLAIRLQRTGREGHATFRVVVQEAQRTPVSGNVVALLGSYDPHTKTSRLDKEKIVLYLSNGAQPSGRVARLLREEGVTLPKWVKAADSKNRKTRNPEKLRSNRPTGEAKEAKETKTEPAVPEEATIEEAVDVPAEPVAEE